MATIILTDVLQLGGLPGAIEIHGDAITIDPSVTGLTAPFGALTFRNTGQAYLKTGAADTAWTLIGNVTSVTPTDIAAGTPAAVGVDTTVSRADHVHGISTATAVAITDSTNNEGSSASLARADHSHAHGSLSGGALHALFTAAAAGFTGPMTVTNPSRAFNTTFQPSATRPVLGVYAVRIVSTLSLGGGGQAGRVELVSDSASPPTTLRDRGAGGITGTVVIGVSLTDTAESTLVCFVSPGDNVRLNTVNETGTPTYTLTVSTEVAL